MYVSDKKRFKLVAYVVLAISVRLGSIAQSVMCLTADPGINPSSNPSSAT